jgi:hypothetical protein
LFLPALESFDFNKKMQQNPSFLRPLAPMPPPNFFGQPTTSPNVQGGSAMSSLGTASCYKIEDRVDIASFISDMHISVVIVGVSCLIGGCISRAMFDGKDTGSDEE